MTSFITGFDEQEVISRDMPPSVAVGFSVFLGACMTGFCLYDMYLKQKDTEKKLKEYEERLAEIEATEEAQDQTLQEHDIRIREKKDYDESEEIEEGKYQCWKGYNEKYTLDMELGFTLKIRLWKEAFNTYKKNHEWVNQEDSTTNPVCDYYLGNRNPDFDWECVQKDLFAGEKLLTADVSETFVDGWDNTVRLRITISCSDWQNIVDFIEEDSYHGDVTLNKLLKKCIHEGHISWSRYLIDV
jgi:hypothetical protein